MPTAPIETDANGKQWYVWDFRAKFQYPYDPDAPIFLLAAPPGGVGVANAPFLVKGESGLNALIDTTIDTTVLEYDDPTPDFAEFVELTPGTETTSQVVQLRLSQRKGAPGANGTATLNAATYGTPIAKRILQVNATADGFEYTPQKVGARYWPTSVTEAGSGTTAGHTITTIGIAANVVPFAYQLEVEGTSIVTGSGADVRVDLVARLGAENGPVLGRGYGVGGTTDRLILSDGPDTNTSTATVTLAANAAATIYFRTEKQAGADTYSTGASPSRFLVKVHPVL